MAKWRFPCKEKSKGIATLPRGSSVALDLFWRQILVHMIANDRPRDDRFIEERK